MMHPIVSTRTGDLLGVTISHKHQQANGRIGYTAHIFNGAWQTFISMDMITCTIDESKQIVTGDTPAQTAIISNVYGKLTDIHKARFDYLVRAEQHYQRNAQLWRDTVKEDGTILYQHELKGE